MPPSQYEGGNANIHGLNDRRSQSARSKADSEDTLWVDDPPAEAGDRYRGPKKRVYFADWARALAI